MKLLIIGSGGREHALGWKLKQSRSVEKIYFAPGNGGTEKLGENVSIGVEEIEKLCKFAKKKNIDLTIVGPEAPLAAGIVDLFQKNHLLIFGPTKKATRLESDKAWAVKFMKRHHIPHPKSFIFSDPTKAIAFVKNQPKDSIVVKASGLAQGKGVLLPASQKEAVAAIEKIMIKKEFGASGEKIVIQEKLAGEEVSLLAFTDGKAVIPLPPAQDHKRVFDHDQGPNTGGMGAYAPAEVLTHKLLTEVKKKILERTIMGMKKEGYPYTGVLYAGLMLTKNGPQVLEYNARFGDPETQPLMMLLKSDLLPILMSCINGSLKKTHVVFRNGASVCVVLAAKGYPGHYEKRQAIHGISKIVDPTIQVFHAGTAFEDKQIVTHGGRVLGVTAYAKNIRAAIKKCYQAIGKNGVYFKNMHYRHDIGLKALKN